MQSPMHRGICKRRRKGNAKTGLWFNGNMMSLIGQTPENTGDGRSISKGSFSSSFVGSWSLHLPSAIE